MSMDVDLTTDIIGPKFHLQKVKYELLDQFNLIKRSTKRAIVYINLESVFKRLIVAPVNDYIQASINMMDDQEEVMHKFERQLVSNVINLTQHYKRYFAKKHIDSKVVLYWNYPLPEDGFKNNKYIATYRATHSYKYLPSINTAVLYDCMEEAINFLQTCIQYVNDVYLVNGGRVEASLIPLILETEVFKVKKSGDGINLIITSDRYDVASAYYGFDLIDVSTKAKTRITKYNAFEALQTRCGTKSALGAPAGFIEFALALIGDDYRNIQSFSGFGPYIVSKTIHTKIIEGVITETTRDINMLSRLIGDPQLREVFIRNYHCTNFELQYKDLEPLDIHKIKSCIVDKYDEMTLYEMNEKYFKDCPIEHITNRYHNVLERDEESPFSSLFNR
jgi:hypothetical protein